MSPNSAHLSCYLAEWYGTDLTVENLDRTAALLDDSALAVSGESSPVRLLTMLAVPDDEVVFGVFTAPSERLVATTCERAGIPVHRLMAAVDARHPEGKA